MHHALLGLVALFHLGHGALAADIHVTNSLRTCRNGGKVHCAALHADVNLALQELNVSLNALQSGSEDVREAPASGGESKQFLALAYTGSFALILCVVAVIYGHRGSKLVICIMMYLTALSTMKLCVKWVFVVHRFRFPMFLTAVHMLSGGLVCGAVFLKSSWQSGVPMSVPTAREMSLVVAPIGLAASASIAASNVALGSCSVAFTEIIGSTTCLTTIMVVIFMGMPFNKWLLIPTHIVVMGCALSTVGEVSFSAFGTMLCIASNIFRSVNVTFQQRLMTCETKKKFDPCTLLLWLSLPAFVGSAVGSAIFEGLEPYRWMAARDSRMLVGLWFAIGASCANAVMLNLAQLFVTRDLGAVGGQLVAQARAVLTVLGGMVLFGETVSPIELIGFAEVLLGVYAFTAMEAASSSRTPPEPMKSAVLEKERSPKAGSDARTTWAP
mmetsp:Transcript_91176/g.263047  ORF Transcript_91176/g.263047 Transcript_91176/m.263047 type:complete len:442 (-) Transcript_91176:147-1472(-)